MRTLPSLPLLDAVMGAFASANGRGSGHDGPVPEMSADLGVYRWQSRLVLLFAESPDIPAYIEQQDVLEAVTGDLTERHIVVLVDTDPGAAGALRARFTPQGFEVLLVGKDGGVKLRQGRPVDAETLFATIDAMPMRRQEMGS